MKTTKQFLDNLQYKGFVKMDAYIDEKEQVLIDTSCDVDLPIITQMLIQLINFISISFEIPVENIIQLLTNLLSEGLFNDTDIQVLITNNLNIKH